jgi:hypothetical protein
LIWDQCSFHIQFGVHHLWNSASLDEVQCQEQIHNIHNFAVGQKDTVMCWNNLLDSLSKELG